MNEQRKQIIQLQEKLKKELNSLNQLAEQRALKEQLEVHIQTIGILVSEKSELQSSIVNMQKKLTSKENEVKHLNQRLENVCKNIVELEKRVAELQQLEAHFKKVILNTFLNFILSFIYKDCTYFFYLIVIFVQINKELVLERDRFSTRLYKVR